MDTQKTSAHYAAPESGNISPVVVRTAFRLPAGLSVVLVGMPGAGKSSIGRRVARRVHLPFVDSDVEVESMTGMTIDQIFTHLGEPVFREQEARAVRRILETPGQVIATGGGALMDPQTLALIKERAVSVFLRASIDLLLERTGWRDDRPLLKGQSREERAASLQALLDVREPIYQQSTLTVVTGNTPPDDTALRVVEALQEWTACHAVADKP